MKKITYLLIVSLIVVSALVFANREIKNETKPSTKVVSVTNKKDETSKKKKWETSPDGIKFKEWEVSPQGKKVYTSYYKVKDNIKAFNNMEAIVTSVTFQRDGKSTGIKWLIVSIEEEEYMMQFTPKEFQKLNSLKVNDKIIVKSRSCGLSPNHPYLIISGDYIARDNQILFKRDLSKNKGC